MNIALTRQLESEIKTIVKSGLYSNTSEFVREAIRHQLYRTNLEKLRMLLVPAKKQMLEGKNSTKSFEQIRQMAKKQVYGKK